jgi:glycosyltransferase involved in cell wall biosynthesis
MALENIDFSCGRLALTARTIGIDGFNLSMPKGSGIATYAYNLNASLRSLGFETALLYGPEQGPGRDNLLNEVTLFDAPPPPSALRAVSAVLRDISSLTAPFGRQARMIARSGAVITRQIARNAPACDALWSSKDVFHSANRAYGALGRFTPLTFRDGGGAKPDVMHWTAALPLRAPGRPNLYTIHDLVPLRLPFATLDNKRRFLNLCREICATADKVVTVSEHSADDLVKILAVDRTRIAVTHQAVDLPKALTGRPDDDVAREIEGAFGLDWKGYFIFFGAIEPKKNLGRVIEAYLASGARAPLVIIGGKAWLVEDEQIEMMYEDIVEVSALRDGLIRRADRVRLYDYMPFSLLVSLIRGAKATLLPSLYEGFGLPVLESMQLGTPVVASTEGSLPEIAGDAALLVDPYDSQAIRRAIMALDGDADLRADLTARGLRQAEKYSPEAYKARLAELYRPFT